MIGHRYGLRGTPNAVRVALACRNQRGVGGAAVAVLLVHRHATTEVRRGTGRHRRVALHRAAIATADAARAGAVLHLVLQVAEGQRLRGQFAVGSVGAGNRTADQIHVAGIDVVAGITGEQARLLAHSLITAVGFASAGVAVSTPRGTERDLRPATHLAVLGHAFGHVLQRLDGQRAAGLYIDAVGRRGGTAQGGVTLGLERDVLADKTLQRSGDLGSRGLALLSMPSQQETSTLCSRGTRP